MNRWNDPLYRWQHVPENERAQLVSDLKACQHGIIEIDPPHNEPWPNTAILVCHARLCTFNVGMKASNACRYLSLSQIPDADQYPTEGERRQAILAQLQTHPYLAAWSLRDLLKANGWNIQDIPDPLVTRDTWSKSLRELLDLGLIEEMPDLGCRYRLVKRQESEVAK